jgi:hypothetical protein
MVLCFNVLLNVAKVFFAKTWKLQASPMVDTSERRLRQIEKLDITPRLMTSG